jgi:DNA-binding XRE family transcriptional regulator
VSKVYTNTPRPYSAPLLPRLTPKRAHPEPVKQGLMTGAELRDFRYRHRLKQIELGEMLGVDRSVISQWECDKKPIPHTIYPYLIMLDHPHAAPVFAIVNHRTHEILWMF